MLVAVLLLNAGCVEKYGKLLEVNKSTNDVPPAPPEEPEENTTVAPVKPPASNKTVTPPPVKTNDTIVTPPAPPSPPPSNETVTPTPASTKQLTIEPNTLAVVYFGSMGSETERLREFKIVEASGGMVVVNNIPRISYYDIPDWDTSYYGIFAHIPSLDYTLLLDKTTSYSYARSTLHARTVGDKVVTLNERGERNPAIGDVEVKDIITGDNVYSVTLSPQSSAGNWAIVGNAIFYTSPTSEDLYGKYTGGGHLYKRDFTSSSSVKLVDYKYPPNSIGDLYAVGSKLYSVNFIYGAQDKTYNYIISELSTSTGEITKEITSFSYSSYATFYDGETALYFTLKTPDAKTYEVYRITGGEAEFMFGVELEPDETGLGRVDESNGYLFVPVLSKNTGTVIAYRLSDGTNQVITIEGLGSGTLSGAEYTVLNPQ